MTIRGFLLLFLTISAFYSHSQTKNELLHWYDSLIGQPNEISTGIAYEPIYTINSHPFYTTKSWANGSLIYNGKEFNDVELLFDISRQVLVLKDIYKGLTRLIELKSTSINAFDLLGNSFEKLIVKEEPVFGMILYKGSDLLAHQIFSKNAEPAIDGSSFDYIETSYVRIDTRGEKKDVYSLKQFVKLFPDQKNDIKTTVKSKKLMWENDEHKIILLKMLKNSLDANLD